YINLLDALKTKSVSVNSSQNTLISDKRHKRIQTDPIKMKNIETSTFSSALNCEFYKSENQTKEDSITDLKFSNSIIYIVEKVLNISYNIEPFLKCLRSFHTLNANEWKISLISDFKTCRKHAIESISFNKQHPDIMISVSNIKNDGQKISNTVSNLAQPISQTCLWHIKCNQVIFSKSLNLFSKLPIVVRDEEFEQFSIEFSSSKPGIYATTNSKGDVNIYLVNRIDISNLTENTTTSRNIGSYSLMKMQTIKFNTFANQILWFFKEEPNGEKNEMILVCTQHGKIYQADPDKNFAASEIMRIRKPSGRIYHLTPGGSVKSKTNGLTDKYNEEKIESGNLTSKNSTLICIGKNLKNENFYSVGSNDGLINECNAGHTESSINIKYSHTHPVVQIVYSPFCDKTYASCGGRVVNFWNFDESQITARIELKNSSKIIRIGWSQSSEGLFFILTEVTLLIYDIKTNL
ncbi:MAG: WD repeat-containing protein 78, partial [Paramarteilia canceri]